MKKLTQRIIAIIILEFLFRAIIRNNGDMLFLVAVNILILWIIFYDDLKHITAQIGNHITSLHRYKPEVVHAFGNMLQYLFKHYLLVISAALLVLSIFDRLFMSYFYLPLWWCFLFFTISILVLLPLVTQMKFFFAGHELKKVDFARWAIVLFFVAMLITLRFLPLYQTYFYALLATLLVSSIWFFILEKKPIWILFRSVFFQIIAWLTIVSFLVFAWKSFPQIRQACTVTKKVYIDRPVYIDMSNKK